MWVRVDDGMHNHRKTRSVTKSHPTKRRDAAPIGVWTLAASWAGQNGTDGWVPEDELDRWDSDWKPLVARLVSAGYWWPHDRDGEQGYGFNDWHDYNDPADAASKAGTYGNHVRWHVNEGKVEPECNHCPTEPKTPETPDVRGDIGGRSGGDSHPNPLQAEPSPGSKMPVRQSRIKARDAETVSAGHSVSIAPRSGGESQHPSGAIALPDPNPYPNPNPNPEKPSSDESDNRPDITPDRFEEFWDTYAKKVKRADAERKWVKALKKPGVTADLLITAAAEYVAYERANNDGGRYIVDPPTWLHGERWTDECAARVQPMTRVQEHLSLVQQLAAEEAEQERQSPRQIGGDR